MTRTEFYKALQDQGRGQFQLDGKGRIRAGQHDPLSFVTWKLHGVEAPGEINRPAKLLGIKNPMRLVLASDLMRGFIGSTRRALLASLALEELNRGSRTALLAEGAQADPRTGRIGDYDPDEHKEYAEDMPADEGDVLPDGQVLAPPEVRREMSTCGRCDNEFERNGNYLCPSCQEEEDEQEAEPEPEPDEDDSDHADEDEQECDCDECRGARERA